MNIVTYSELHTLIIMLNNINVVNNKSIQNMVNYTFEYVISQFIISSGSWAWRKNIITEIRFEIDFIAFIEKEGIKQIYGKKVINEQNLIILMKW